MHVYIYDDFLVKRKYENLLASIETRITDLGLNGKIIRLGNMKSTISLLENELKQGAKTIIAVGNDSTVNKVLNKILSHQQKENSNDNMPLGIIPIGSKNNFISASLGIKNEEDACDILAARRIEKIDVGQIEPTDPGQSSIKKYFISHVYVPSQGTTIEIDKKYSIELIDGGEISILNLPILKTASNPQDGKLELVIENKKNKKISFNNSENQSIFSFKKLVIINPKNQILLDNSLQVNPPIEISALKRKFNVIVGKSRNF